MKTEAREAGTLETEAREAGTLETEAREPGAVWQCEDRDRGNRDGVAV